MRMCERARYAQVINRNGEVRLCAWAGHYKIGNLIDNSFEELFAKDKTKRFLDTLRDKTYDYCVEEECPFQANNDIDDHMLDFDGYPKIPNRLSISYSTHCNYNCTCCVQHDNTPVDIKKQEKIEKEILKILPNVTILESDGNGEFFCSDSIIRLVNEWEPKDKKNGGFGMLCG